MLLNGIDNRIRRAFSDSAMRYEVLAGMQREIGRELCGKIPDRDYATVLDVGMGTGRLTQRLAMRFPGAFVAGMDFAPGMAAAAAAKYPDLRVVQADARRPPFRAGTFDLIVSNLAYQWLADLAAAFARHAEILRPGGEFVFTLFGRQTLRELCAALEETADGAPGRDGNGVFRRLAGFEDVRLALERAGLPVIRADAELITAHFADMMELLRWLKGIGASGMPAARFLGKERLQRTAEVYRRRFGDRWGVTATFEVLWFMARK